MVLGSMSLLGEDATYVHYTMLCEDTLCVQIIFKVLLSYSGISFYQLMEMEIQITSSQLDNMHVYINSNHLIHNTKARSVIVNQNEEIY